jgi:hypothetical protein
LLLKLTWSKTRDGSCNKNRMKEMKCGPQQLAANKGHFTELDQKGKATSLDWGSS